MVKKRTDEELLKACEHIRYEILMLHHSMFRMADKQFIIPDKNSFVESYAIHVRNLVEFLRCKPKGEYVRAEDYLEQKDIVEWRTFLSKYAKTFSTIQEKSAVQLAHLSYDRSNYAGNKKAWEFKYCRVIDECLVKWLSLVPKSRISEGLKKLIPHFHKVTPALLEKTLSGFFREL